MLIAVAHAQAQLLAHHTGGVVSAPMGAFCRSRMVLFTFGVYGSLKAACALHAVMNGSELVDDHYE